jgi:hypothetical protein
MSTQERKNTRAKEILNIQFERTSQYQSTPTFLGRLETKLDGVSCIAVVVKAGMRRLTTSLQSQNPKWLLYHDHKKDKM